MVVIVKVIVRWKVDLCVECEVVMGEEEDVVEGGDLKGGSHWKRSLLVEVEELGSLSAIAP